MEEQIQPTYGVAFLCHFHLLAMNACEVDMVVFSFEKKTKETKRSCCFCNHLLSD